MFSPVFVTSRFSCVFPPPKNMQIGRLAMINCPRYECVFMVTCDGLSGCLTPHTRCSWDSPWLLKMTECLKKRKKKVLK